MGKYFAIRMRILAQTAYKIWVMTYEVSRRTHLPKRRDETNKDRIIKMTHWRISDKPLLSFDKKITNIFKNVRIEDIKNKSRNKDKVSKREKNVGSFSFFLYIVTY